MPTPSQSLLETRQKNVGKLPESTRVALLTAGQRDYRKANTVLITLGVLLAATCIAVAVISNQIMTAVIAFLVMAFLALIFGSVTSTGRRRLKKLKQGNLDIFEMNGKLTIQAIRVPGNPYSMRAITSYALLIDDIMLPAIVELENVARLEQYMSNGFNPENVTVQYIPSVFLNLFIDDNSGHRLDFMV